MGENEVTVCEPQDNLPVNQYDQILELAISQGAALDQLEKWLQLKERHEAGEARKAYHAAMSKFKANPPRIIKDKRVGYQGKGQSVGYSHASLANVASSIGTELSKYGLSAAWNTEQSEAGVKVTCTITHKLGHGESTSLTASPDNSGSKNSIQAIGSTITYLERYTLLALTGLSAHDQDDDGRAAEAERITTDQCTEIEDLINETYKTDAKKKQWLDYMHVTSASEIPASKYKMAVNSLKRAKGGTNNG